MPDISFSIIAPITIALIVVGIEAIHEFSHYLSDRKAGRKYKLPL